MNKLKYVLSNDVIKYVINRYYEFYYNETIISLGDLHKKIYKEMPEKYNNTILLHYKDIYCKFKKGKVSRLITGVNISFYRYRKYLYKFSTKKWKSIREKDFYKYDAKIHNTKQTNNDTSWTDWPYMYIQDYKHDDRIHVHNFEEFLKENKNTKLRRIKKFRIFTISLNLPRENYTINIFFGKKYMYIIAEPYPKNYSCSVHVYLKPGHTKIKEYKLRNTNYYCIRGTLLYTCDENICVYNAVSGEKLGIIKTNYNIRYMSVQNNILFCHESDLLSKETDNLHLYSLDKTIKF